MATGVKQEADDDDIFGQLYGNSASTIPDASNAQALPNPLTMSQDQAPLPFKEEKTTENVGTPEGPTDGANNEEEEDEDDIDVVLHQETVMETQQQPKRLGPSPKGAPLSLSIGRGYGRGAPPPTIAGMAKGSFPGQAVAISGTQKSGPTAGLPAGGRTGKSALEIDVSQYEDKPWRRPGADITDYFNYGFNEESWPIYRAKQNQLRLEASMQGKIKVFESQKPERGDLPPELLAASGIEHDSPALLAQKMRGNQNTKGRGRSNQPNPGNLGGNQMRRNPPGKNDQHRNNRRMMRDDDDDPSVVQVMTGGGTDMPDESVGSDQGLPSDAADYDPHAAGYQGGYNQHGGSRYPSQSYPSSGGSGGYPQPAYNPAYSSSRHHESDRRQGRGYYDERGSEEAGYDQQGDQNGHRSSKDYERGRDDRRREDVPSSSSASTPVRDDRSRRDEPPSSRSERDPRDLRDSRESRDRGSSSSGSSRSSREASSSRSSSSSRYGERRDEREREPERERERHSEDKSYKRSRSDSTAKETEEDRSKRRRP